MSIGFHTTNEDSTTYTYQINFKGSTNSNTSSPWRAFYNTSTKKFRLFWYYNDYNAAQINVLSRSGFNVPTNGTWYTALPSDNGTELTIYYNNAQTATQLLNSRKINGTSFNGTADITTSYWGATRTISLTGAITGSVSTNGSGNITINTTYNTGNITNLDNRYVRKAGDTMSGNLAFSTGKQAKWTAHGTSYITDGNADNGSFTTSCSGQTYTGKTAVGINCRSGIVYAAKFTGPLQGNATSATQLQTSRKINGTSFNGTTDITTSYWGSTRTLTIGNTGKSVNGSGNVSWSLSEIGAASSNHTHNYITMYRTSQLDSDSFSTYVKNYAKGVTAISNVTATVGNISTTATVLNVGHSTTRFWRIFSARGTNASIYFQGPNSDGTGWDTKQRLLTSANSSVSKSGETLTVTINGVTQSLTNTNTTNTTGASNTSSKIFLIGATSQSPAVQTYSHDTAYVGTDGCLYSNNTKVSVEGHTHGTLHSTFTTKLNNTTTDSGWSMINSSYNGFLLKSIRTQSSAPNWIENNYAAGICFGGDDTKGVLSIAYSSPAIKFAGGNGTKPVWWVRLLGASGATYNLANFNAATATKLATARTINGTSFDGTANITTAKWGTARTIYIQDASGAHGGTGVSVDGSTNYNLKLPSTITATLVGNASSATNADKLDGQHASAFSYKSWWHWSGQSGQPSWIWGGNSENNYYVYNPSNFSVNYAKSAGNADTLDGQHSTHFFRKYNRSEMGSSMNLNTLKTFGIFEIRTSEVTTTNAPKSGYYPLLNFVNGEHVQMQIAGTTGQLFYRADQTSNIGTSAGFTHSWATFIDNTNYTSYVKKIGTSTVGGTDKPIYLSSGTPTPISSTKGSATLPVYLNAGTITTCTPSSLFSNLSNSGTKLSISVAGQNRTLTVMYATSTQYVVSSGNQTALSGTTAANSGIRLYEAYNNGYPISYGNLLSMKGRGSTELLMGWKSGSNRMYYRSNSDINEGWTSWQTVATLADISNAVKTGTTGHLAYYSSASSVSSYDSNVGNSYTPIYLSSGVPKACNGVIITQFADYDIYCNSSNASFIKSQGNFSPVQSVTRISTGLVRIQFSVNPNQFKIILVPMSTQDNGFKQRYVTDYAGYDTGSGKVNTIVVGVSDDYSRNDGSFHMYIFNFNFL